MTQVYLSLGTNLGERLDNLATARAMLSPDVRVEKLSSVYETAPWGYSDQANFYNQVLLGKTMLTPLRLLNKLKRIEKMMGREQTFRYGPRVIDLDILFYESRIINTKRLQIPHPRLQERAFVLVPLVEIAPDFVHPQLGLTMQALLGQVGEGGVQKLC